MAFWGVEVKPGKPVTLSVVEPRRRLRISQATLGIGDALKKSIVQCNVGKRIPMLLCVLLPNQTESCHLDLEFEEADNVVFSVIGPRSVYLTGYYIRGSQFSNPHSDTESFGEDIANSETEGSGCCSEDDRYEDSFINDDEPEVEPPSPVPSSNGVDEITPENRFFRGKKLNKKYQVIESDDESESHENEDNDGYLLSVFKSERAVKNSKNDGEKLAHVTAEISDKQSKKDGLLKSKSKQKVDPTMEVSVNKGEFTTDKVIREKGDTWSSEQKPPSGNETEQKQSHKQTKPRKKRRKCSGEKVQSGSCDGEDNEEASIDTKPVVKLVDSHSENGKRSKKRRKEIQSEGTHTKDMPDHHVAEDGKSEKDSLCADRRAKDLPAMNGDHKQQSDKIREKKHKIKREEKSLGQGNLIVTDNHENQIMKHEDRTADLKPMHKKTLSNGLVIEELANGAPDAKVANHGKKVKIYYTAMLKDNGHIFDSNVGKAACKFRLGGEEIMDGWNIGINGMRVGDKRRLTIPPSMGFGKHQSGENVPPKSWLVYDVELVGVYK